MRNSITEHWLLYPGHARPHGHDHAHAPDEFGPAFAIATALNLGLVAAQVFYGVVAHSVALLADAGHNFGDALGLVIAWSAHVLSKLNPTAATLMISARRPSLQRCSTA